MSFNEREMKLARFFTEREGDGILGELREIDFFDSGIIDSLDLVSLAVFIEKNFNKKIDLANSATLSAARHFDSLMAIIESRT